MKFSCLCVISPFPSENCKCHMLPTTMAVRNSSYYKFNEEHVEKKSSGIRNFLKVCGFTDLRSNCNLAFISWAFKKTCTKKIIHYKTGTRIHMNGRLAHSHQTVIQAAAWKDASYTPSPYVQYTVYRLILALLFTEAISLIKLCMNLETGGNAQWAN